MNVQRVLLEPKKSPRKVCALVLVIFRFTSGLIFLHVPKHISAVLSDLQKKFFELTCSWWAKYFWSQVYQSDTQTKNDVSRLDARLLTSVCTYTTANATRCARNKISFLTEFAIYSS